MAESLNGAASTAPDPTPNAPPPPPPPKRGPGRPRKTPVGDGATPAETPLNGAAPKRGRPPKHKIEVDTSLLAKQLVGLHLIGARFTGAPEMAISEGEAQAMADAIANVAREYNLSIDGKTGAALQLAIVCVGIYVPRMMQINARKKKDKAEAIDNEPAAVN